MTENRLDLDALEKRLNADSRQNITRYFGDLSGAIVAHELLRDAAAAVAELKEARSTVEELLYAHTDKSIAMGRAFLARNGEGEE